MTLAVGAPPVGAMTSLWVPWPCRLCPGPSIDIQASNDTAATGLWPRPWVTHCWHCCRNIAVDAMALLVVVPHVAPQLLLQHNNCYCDTAVAAEAPQLVSLIRSFNCACVHSFVPLLFVRSPTRSFVRSFFPWFVQLFIFLLICSLGHWLARARAHVGRRVGRAHHSLLSPSVKTQACVSSCRCM